jgi:hypothetical protein
MFRYGTIGSLARESPADQGIRGAFTSTPIMREIGRVPFGGALMG